METDEVHLTNLTRGPMEFVEYKHFSPTSLSERKWQYSAEGRNMVARGRRVAQRSASPQVGRRMGPEP
jgi:hypothetical protein